jgi:AcrR family transcriptional regulator
LTKYADPVYNRYNKHTVWTVCIMNTKKRDAAIGTRRRLLKAAIETMQVRGPQALTLDAVAAEAGVSKGGLLHHFRSKDALLEAILRQLFADFNDRVQQVYEAEPSRPGRWLRAYVRASFADDPLPLELAAMLLVAVSENTALLGLIQEDAARWHTRLLDDGIPAARATVVRQAADAMWTERLMQLPSDDPALRQQVLAELLALAEA